jgi:thiol-disulfide isomerase/thioredoxin
VSGTRKRIALVLGALVALQLAAVLVYRVVERRRTESRARTPFTYEKLTLEQRGLDVPLRTRGGATLTLQRFRGAPVLVHFWATWCAPCRTELPKLLEVASDTKLDLVLVSVDADWKVIRHFFEDDLPSGVVLDESAEARRAFGVTTLPDTYLLDSAGRTLARFRGPREWSNAKPRLMELTGSRAETR